MCELSQAAQRGRERLHGITPDVVPAEVERRQRGEAPERRRERARAGADAVAL